MPVAFLKSDEEKWLASESTWKFRFGTGWKGTKFLGRGGFGVCGLWEYQRDQNVGKDGEEYDIVESEITKVVVKMGTYENETVQTALGPKHDFDEGRWGAALSLAKSEHIVRQYGAPVIGDEFGEMGPVIKIFLEFCPGGDLDQFLPRNAEEENNPKPLLQEPDLWSLFHCMALGIFVMDRGTEDPVASPPDWWKGESMLYHGDLKMDNVILGYRNTDHARIPVAKIADFGETSEVPAYADQTDEYGSLFADRGAMEFKPPEEIMSFKNGPWRSEFAQRPVKSPRKGTCSNIWQIGAIMNCLMLRKRLQFNNAREGLVSQPSKVLNPLLKPNAAEHNHTQGLGDADIFDRYSSDLLGLVMECMLRSPGLRPSASDLVNRTRAGLAAANEEAKNLRALPENFERVPVLAGPEWPEPPTAWTVDHQRFEDGTFRVPSTPTSRNSSIFSSPAFQTLGSVFSTATPPSRPTRSPRSSLFGGFGSMNSMLSSLNLPSESSFNTTSEEPSPASSVYWSATEWENFMKSPQRSGTPATPTPAGRAKTAMSGLLDRGLSGLMPTSPIQRSPTRRRR